MTIAQNVTPTFTMEQVKNIRSEMLKLKPANPARVRADLPLRTKGVIMLLAPDLLKMRAKGFTDDELLAALDERGVQVKAGTLNKYLKAHQKGVNGKASMPVADRNPPVAASGHAKTDAVEQHD